MLLTGKYDLVISDVMMPEMDGITMLKNIKNNSNTVSYTHLLYIYNVESGKVTVLNMQQRGDKGFLCNDWVRSMGMVT